ncbi:MAG: Gfo/Idh/MocA family protein [Propylenella sp.]
MPKVRLAIIGLGMASAPHVKSLNDLRGRVEVAAVYSPSAERRRTFAEKHSLPAVENLDAILSDSSIDAVMILTPPNTHLDLVRRAAAAGKHILLEKPLEITLQRAEELVAASETANVMLGVVLQHRFRPISVALAELLRENRLGPLVVASARLHNWRPQSYYDQPGRGTKARDGGGVLITQAIHTLDLLIALAGLPDEVTAYCTTSAVHRMETEDVAMGAIRYANGVLGTISATTCAFPGHPDAVELIGTKGMARLDGATLSVSFHDGSKVEKDDGGLGGGAGADPMAFPHDHHRAVLADFLDAIAIGRDPRVSGREALKVHRLIDALLRSAETGERQRVFG